MKKILFVHYAFELGGICSSLVNLISEISKHSEFDISLMVLNGDNPKAVNLPLNCKVVRTPFLLQVISQNFANIRRCKEKKVLRFVLFFLTRIVRRFVGKIRLVELVAKCTKLSDTYDFAIAFANDTYGKESNCILCGCNQFVKNGITSLKKYAWIHAIPEQIGYNADIIYKTYSGFDKVVSCNKTCRDLFVQMAPDFEAKAFFVHNLINVISIKEKAKEINPYMVYGDVINIVTVARLENSTKRLDRIPKVMELLVSSTDRHYIWHIVGDGPDREVLKEEIAQKGLSKVVLLHGSQKNPYPFISNADVYVQTSDYEAMPMVILEAECLGVPIVTTNYPAAEEMVGERYGIVVDKSVMGIYNGIQKISSTSSNYRNIAFIQNGYEQFKEICTQ